MIKNSFISLILLAGGKGTRLKGPVPKQFLPLGDKPLALHSFEHLSSFSFIKEVIVVCEESFEAFFSLQEKDLKFALPGKRRQDSVLHGLKAVSEKSELVCIHDAARPFVYGIPFKELVQAAIEHGAAALGQKVVNTIKRCCDNQSVIQTLPREELWAIQTPQVIQKELLEQGYANLKNQDVTDDVSIIESLGRPVKIVESHPNNFKVTTIEDLERAQQMLSPSLV